MWIKYSLALVANYLFFGVRNKPFGKAIPYLIVFDKSAVCFKFHFNYEEIEDNLFNDFTANKLPKEKCDFTYEMEYHDNGMTFNYVSLRSCLAF